MNNEPWQKRLRRASLTQAELARLAGTQEQTISAGLRGKGKGGVPIYLRTILRLWEVADEDAKKRILDEPDVEA